MAAMHILIKLQQILIGPKKVKTSLVSLAVNTLNAKELEFLYNYTMGAYADSTLCSL